MENALHLSYHLEVSVKGPPINISLCALHGKGWGIYSVEKSRREFGNLVGLPEEVRQSLIFFLADGLILFTEASLQQARVLQGVLERFCDLSGQKVSIGKSRLFCSKNVKWDLADQIRDRTGVSLTNNLGKYLGILLLLVTL